MKSVLIAAIVATAFSVVPASAQVGTSPPVINAKQLEEANGAEAAIAHAQNIKNEEQKAQYAADVAAYQRALRKRARMIAANDRRYADQQHAYAAAMAAWRAQVAACREGRMRACKAPPPKVADYLP